mmetsp:Transcript_9048/g.15295  ORF Transcript_9048/g.15295 Transcript_9048/m.15295 type:complete len:156 (-) Transcript_9048:494-961(-)
MVGSTVVILRTLPSDILTMRLAKFLRPWSWVTMIIVILCLILRSTRIFMMMSVDLVSRSPVGSSSSKMEGLFEMDLAMVTLYCSPPESMLGKWSSLSPSPTSVRSCLARFLISSLLSFPLNCMGSSTFSRAESEPIRLKVWKTKPSLFSLIDAST